MLRGKIKVFVEVITTILDSKQCDDADASHNVLYLHPPQNGVSWEEILPEFGLVCFIQFNRNTCKSQLYFVEFFRNIAYFTTHCNGNAADESFTIFFLQVRG